MKYTHQSMVLICIPLISWWKKHLFISLLDTQESSSVNYLGLFFCWIVFIFLLICNYCSVTVSNLFCQLSVLQTFSLSVRLVFSFCFMVPVHENTFLILVPNLSVFHNLCFFWCLVWKSIPIQRSQKNPSIHFSKMFTFFSCCVYLFVLAFFFF